MNELPTSNKKQLIPVDTIIGVTNGKYHGKLMTFHVFYGNACLPTDVPTDKFVLLPTNKYEAILREFLESDVGQNYYVPTKTEIYQDTAQTFEKIKNHEYDDRIALFYHLNEQTKNNDTPVTAENALSQNTEDETQESANDEQEINTTENTRNVANNEEIPLSKEKNEVSANTDTELLNQLAQENVSVEQEQPTTNEETSTVEKAKSELETKNIKEELTQDEIKEEPKLEQPKETVEDVLPNLENKKEVENNNDTQNLNVTSVDEFETDEKPIEEVTDEKFIPQDVLTEKVEEKIEETLQEKETLTPSILSETEKLESQFDNTEKEKSDADKFLEEMGIEVYDPHKYDIDNFLKNIDDDGDTTDIIDEEVELADTNDIQCDENNPWKVNASKYNRRKVVNSSDFNSVVLEKVLNIDKRLNKYLDEETDRFYVPKDLVPAEQTKELLEMVKAELESCNEKMDTYKKGHKTIATLNLVLFILQILMFAGIAFMFFANGS